MFQTKKEVDKHVKSSISKLPEKEKNLRGFTIAKLYFKIGEFASAQQWLLLYLAVNEENAAVHKLLGQCYEKRKLLDKAIESYKRSYQLDNKQKSLISDCCKLFLADDTLLTNPVRAKYWCDLADSEQLQNENVLSLKLKLTKDSRIVEDLLVKETIARPTDVNLRIRLVKNFLDEQKVAMAFKYCNDVALKFNVAFMQSIDWHNCVAVTLTAYQDGGEKSPAINQWDIWLLQMLTVEHQIGLNLATDTNVLSNEEANMKETVRLLFEFDQLLQKASEVVIVICGEKELAGTFLQHYRGQLCLHMASYLFKVEQVYNRNQWRDTTRKCLPLLLLAHQCGYPNLQENWLRNSSDATRQLVGYWRRQAAYRCVQAGKCLSSCVDANASTEQDVIQQIRLVTDSKNWKTADDVSAQIRQFCMDTNWRQQIFRTIFTKTDQLAQCGSSYFVRSTTLAEPTTYELPAARATFEMTEAAQNWNLGSLQHLVYVGMGDAQCLAELQCEFRKNLNISTNNLANCNSDTLNRLDLDSFLVCSVVVANRAREVERHNYESYSERPNDRPGMLPAANMLCGLCTDDQIEWWTAAYKFVRQTGENTVDAKSLLQFGIEAVRGVGAIKIDLYVLFKLAKVLADRGLQAIKAEEKRALEARSEELYKHALHYFKMRQSGALDTSQRSLFKFSTTNFDVHRELNSVAEDAVIYLAKRYFAGQKYEECIEELQDVQLPFAAYFLSEAYRKMDESKKTPRKDRQLYTVKVRDYYEEAIQLLNEPLVDKNHPLRSILSSRTRRANNEALNVSASNGYSHDDHTDEFHDTSATSFRARAMQHTRDQSFSSAGASKTLELENLIRKMMETLNLVKEDVVTIRHDVTEIQDKLQKLEDNQKRQQQQTDLIADVARGGDDDLSDMYLLDDMQNQYLSAPSGQGYAQQQQQVVSKYPLVPPAALNYSQFYNAAAAAHPMYSYLNSPAAYRTGQQQQQQYGDQLLMTAATGYAGVLPQQQPTQPQQQMGANNSYFEQALSNPQLLRTWNSTYNNQQQAAPIPPIVYQPPAQVAAPTAPPVRTAPVNVVITRSDPLPPTPTISQAPMTVTIPPHLIKNTTSTPHFATTAPVSVAPKPFFEKISPADGETSADGGATLNTSAEYDPRPDFQPIIPLPDEIEVKTGEENENVLFSSRAKLFRFDTATKEWKEKGIGDMKILSNKDSGKIRVLMRRDQVHKICANHNIAPTMDLKAGKQATALTWVAKDFADGELKTETLCVRFKLPETAVEFKRVFDEAKVTMAHLEKDDDEEEDESSGNDVSTSFTFSTPKSKTLSAVSTAAVETPVATNTVAATKAEFGGFSQTKANTPFGGGLLPAPTLTTTTPKFSFTPSAAATPKTPAAPVSVDKKKEETKPSPFANFSFSLSSAAAPAEQKSFSDIFSSLKMPTTTPPAASASTNLIGEEKKASYTVQTTETDQNDDEEYVPTAQFAPVIPLPELIDVKTGEEDENCTFEHRAKLLRYDTTTKEWKERGVGNMKILVAKGDSDKVRLLMRRDQVHKLCCNQRLYKDTKFSKLPKSETALSWAGPDFSENEMKLETLAIRFKTADICLAFNAAVKEAQMKMNANVTQDGAKEASQPETKKEEMKKGFGDQFKPKIGAWNCDACYTSNKPESKKCVACEAPKPGLLASPKPSATVGSQYSFGSGGFLFSDKATEPSKKVGDVKPSGFGDQFKPKAGSWSCADCYTSNTADNLHCVACEAPKDPTVPKKEAGLGLALSSSNSSSKFSFGVPTAATTADTTSTFAFGKPTSGGFSFGSPAAQATSTSASMTASLFAPATGAPSGGFSFGNFAKTTSEPTKETTSSLEKPSFEFVMKPKSPGKVKSPLKSPGAALGHASSTNEDYADNEYHEEEENTTYFTPVIALPDKIDVVTGEEDEESLYCHRAKLFVFAENEWKERGIGDVKIQKHRQTGKLRVLMRREKVLKICLNHPLTAEVIYKPKDDKSWLFGVNDFSEGYFETRQFSLRFKTAEIAADFKMAINAALIDSDKGSMNGHSHTEKDATATPSTQIVISAEERMLAQKLKLPESFYESANNSPACRGCRGCTSDEYAFSNVEVSNDDIVDATPLPLQCSQIRRLAKSVVSQTPVSVFASPSVKLPIRNLFGGSSQENTPSTMAQSIFGGESAKNVQKEDKENKPVDVKSTFSFLGASQESTRPTSIFSSQLNTTSVVQQSQFSAPTQSIFGGGVANTNMPATSTTGGNLFSGNSFNAAKTGQNTPIFGGSAMPMQKPTNIFGATGSGASMFSFATAAKDLDKSEAVTEVTAITTTTTTSIFNTDSSLSFGALAATITPNTNDLSREQSSKSPDFLNVNDSLSFASLAAKTDNNGGFLEGGANNSEFKGFKGLTIKEDIFSKLANKSTSASTDPNTSSGGGDEATTDENYDPHYEPIIQLPDEIVVKTGEEDEEKLFGDRAKLFRYDPNTKEWKERGVGELKILFHPVNGSYRLLLRREQIHKLVLNHAITEDFAINPMNTSRQAFCWGAMNHAEEPAAVEKLAARFKNEDLAAKFRTEVEQCVESLRKRAGLEPEED